MNRIVGLLSLLFLLFPARSQYCKRALFQSYALSGELQFTNNQHPICTTIKKNCCTGEDTKKILSDYGSFLKPKLDDFAAKMKQSFQSLSNLNYLASMVTFRTDLTGPQQAFCANVQSQFQAFPFQQLTKDLEVGFAISQRLFRELHGTFYCALCDYEAQQFMSLETRSVALDSSTCLNILSGNRLFLAAQNINLIQYFQNLQNLLDCNTFTGFYNFPFLYSDRLQLANSFKACYSNFDADSITTDCAKVCQNLGTGTISSIFEGDFEFIAQASSYFINQIVRANQRQTQNNFNPLNTLQQLNERNEQVSFIQIPNKNQMRVAAFNSTSDNRRKLAIAAEIEKKQGTLSSIWEKLSHPIRSLFGANEPKVLPFETLSPAKKSIKRKASKHKNRWDFGNQFSAISKSQQDILKRLRKAFKHSSNSRILSDDGHLGAAVVPKFHDSLRPRVLQTTMSGSGNQNIAYYTALYDSMVFFPDQNSTEMNPRAAEPFDIGKFKINAVFGQGLNLGMYLGAMNWEISLEALARRMKGLSNSDEPDPMLTYLLNFFNPAFFKGLNNDISADFVLKLESGAESPDDAEAKKVTPQWEKFETFNPVKVANRFRKSKGSRVSAPLTVQPEAMFHNGPAFRNSRRLKQRKQSLRVKPKRNNWVQRHKKVRATRLNAQKKNSRLNKQKRRSQGYGHKKRRANLRHRNAKGRALADRLFLDHVEGDLNIAPWLNV